MSRPSPSDPRLSRRRFVKGAAATAVSVPLFLHGQAFAATRDDPETLKVGLIGCGGRGTGAAVNALHAEDGTVRLVAMADVFSDRIETSHGHLKTTLGEERAHLVDVDEDHRFVGFDAAQQLIDSDVDVVILTTPPHFRPAHLRAAITAGKHVFCEKPVAVDAPGVHSILETGEMARAANLSLVCGFCWRYNDPHREFYSRIHAGALGELRAVYSTYNASPLGTHPRQPEWSDMEWQLRNWQHFLWLGGDHLVEQAVHSLDKMAWTMKDTSPISCVAVGGRAAREGAERGNIYDHFSVTYDYPGEVKAFHMSRQIANASYDNSDWVYGADGVGKILGGGSHAIEGPRAWTYEGAGNNMYQTEHDELFASIRSGKPMNDSPWMAHSTMLAIMGRMAAYTGKTITWDQALASTESLGPTRYDFGEVAARPVPVPGKTKFV